jgi:hypothetical protein
MATSDESRDVRDTAAAELARLRKTARDCKRYGRVPQKYAGRVHFYKSTSRLRRSRIMPVAADPIADAPQRHGHCREGHRVLADCDRDCRTCSYGSNFSELFLMAIALQFPACAKKVFSFEKPIDRGFPLVKERDPKSLV